eukprot:GHUV01028388.1.p2 GENE.GHUV01028388.1~~GHUV01028388.1.p2  ORF type:complete len:101 (+),score=25.85 GHUV01028388.1:530-832(+)
MSPTLQTSLHMDAKYIWHSAATASCILHFQSRAERTHLLRAELLGLCLFVGAGECRIPIISLSKEVHMADLIGPVMKQSDATVIHRYRPWHEKKDKAFFR